jgi:uncharacterized SAM-binding protein YcdF (DUF218 family)
VQLATSIAKVLILPPSGLLLLVAVGWLVATKWRRAGNVLMGLGLILLYLLSTPLVSGALLRGQQTIQAIGPGDYDPEVGAIVVLSAGLRLAAPEYGGDTVDGMTLQRLRYGARLHRATGLPLLVTGGVPEHATVSIAEVMGRTLQDAFQVPTAWVEPQASNTYENALYSSEILRSAGIRRIYLVTHAWHMPRAVWAFEAMGLEVVPAPMAFLPEAPADFRQLIPSAGGLAMGYYASYEWLARAWYVLVYRKR